MFKKTGIFGLIKGISRDKIHEKNYKKVLDKMPLSVYNKPRR